MCCGRTARSSHRRFSIKKLFFSYKAIKFTISTGNTCVGVFFLNVFFKRPQHRCFPVNIAKFLILLISKSISHDCFLTLSMVHCYMGLKVQGLECMTALGFRVWVIGQFFVFKLAWTESIPQTCFQKSKTNAFDSKTNAFAS